MLYAALSTMPLKVSNSKPLILSTSKPALTLEALGVSVIPCHGKSNLDKPAAIFTSLGIPVFLMWDSDRGRDGARAEENHAPLSLLGVQVEDWPSGVGQRHACFEVDLETQLEADLGNDFDAILREAQAEFGIPKKSFAMKKPDVVRRLVNVGRERGRQCAILEAAVRRIVALAREVGVAPAPAGRPGRWGVKQQFYSPLIP